MPDCVVYEIDSGHIKKGVLGNSKLKKSQFTRRFHYFYNPCIEKSKRPFEGSSKGLLLFTYCSMAKAIAKGLATIPTDDQSNNCIFLKIS
jgi:hypothetical protein